MATQSTSKYRISTQPSDFDVRLIYEFLSGTYWAKGVPHRVVAKSIRNSLCFAVFDGKRQIGFARVITDRATFAYLADVFIVPSHRGRGLAKKLIGRILAHRELRGLRRILLATRDAHRLYTPFGFKPLSHPERFLTISVPNPYQPKRQIKRRSAP